MTRSELISLVCDKNSDLPCKITEEATRRVFEIISESLVRLERVELRGFGSFSTRYRSPKTVRNPKSGDYLHKEGSHAIHFRPGKELKNRVNANFLGEALQEA